jgi:hypothetical protein
MHGGLIIWFIKQTIPEYLMTRCISMAEKGTRNE